MTLAGVLPLLLGVVGTGCFGEIIEPSGATGVSGGAGLPGTAGSPNGDPGMTSITPGGSTPRGSTPGGSDPGAVPSNTPGSTVTQTPGIDPLPGPPTHSAGARRLNRDELGRSLARLLGPDVPIDTTALPKETFTPFDNDIADQAPSMLLVESIEGIARDVAGWVTATPARLQRVLPCTPANATDAACFGQFVDGFGRRVLRHPLDADTANEMRELISYAKASGKFADAVNAALRVFFMHPEFLYRIEIGTPVSAGRVSLTSYELASRLAFLIQGMTPDDALLTAADGGALETPEGVLAEAKRLLASDEGKQQLRRFHALWLGYAALDQLPIHKKLRTETDALVDRATEVDRDYRYLLLADETLVDAELATHYGLATVPTDFAWVPYGATPRRGILSEGLFAAAGAKFTDTSPTRRGKFIRERLLCQPVPLPPPAVSVDVDLPPDAKDPTACKAQRYEQHRKDPTCAGCHALMDPIGFGLENFDELGGYRTNDKDRPECKIDGVGQLDSQTTFTGAKELANLLAASPNLGPCVGQHFLRFAMGRGLESEDVRRAQWLGDELGKSDNRFSAMVLAFVTHENFRIREE